MRLNTILYCACFSLLTLVPAGLADTIDILYAGIGNSAGSAAPIDGSLDILNQANATPTLVGKPASVGITGLVFDNLGNLWGSANSRTTTAPILEKINPSTGAQISSVNLTDANGGAALPIGDLAFQPTQNVLFGITNSGVLYTINTSTGVGTEVGDTGTGNNGGIGFATDGTLYMSGTVPGRTSDNLYTLSPTTGAVLTTVTVTQFFDGLAVRPSDGTIFANEAQVDGIYTINPNTGATTLVGTIGNGKASDLAFLETTATPEPATRGVTAAVLLAVILFRRRLAC